MRDGSTDADCQAASRSCPSTTIDCPAGSLVRLRSHCGAWAVSDDAATPTSAASEQRPLCGEHSTKKLQVRNRVNREDEQGARRLAMGEG